MTSFNSTPLCYPLISPSVGNKLSSYYKEQYGSSNQQYINQVKANALCNFFLQDTSAEIKNAKDGQTYVYDCHNTWEDEGSGWSKKWTYVSSSDKTHKEGSVFYTHMEHLNSFFQKAFGEPILRKKCGMQCLIDYPEDNNCFWSPKTCSVYIGRVDDEIFNPFVKLYDVVGHEFGHGFTQFSSKLVYANQSGALNESFSDFLGILAKQYRNGQSTLESNWLIAEKWLKKHSGTGTALRSMSDPGKAYLNHPAIGSDSQVGHMDNYLNTTSDCGGVHTNSGIPNKAFYLVAKNLGGYAWEKSGQIWYQAVLKTQSNAQFVDFARLTASCAKDRYGSKEEDVVRKAWREVGVSTDNINLTSTHNNQKKANSEDVSRLYEMLTAITLELESTKQKVKQQEQDSKKFVTDKKKQEEEQKQDDEKKAWERELNKMGFSLDDINATRLQDSATALIVASTNGDKGMVAFLIKMGAKLDLQDRGGATALMRAASRGHIAVMKLLINKGANVNMCDQSKRTALMNAAAHGTKEGVGILINAGADLEALNKDGGNALMAAVGNNKAEALEFLIKKEAQVDIQAKDGRTALMLAAANRCVKTVQLLLNAKAQLHLRDKLTIQGMTGRTALQWASYHCKGQTDAAKEVIKLLTNAGAKE